MHPCTHTARHSTAQRSISTAHHTHTHTHNKQYSKTAAPPANGNKTYAPSLTWCLQSSPPCAAMSSLSAGGRSSSRLKASDSRMSLCCERAAAGTAAGTAAAAAVVVAVVAAAGAGAEAAEAPWAPPWCCGCGGSTLSASSVDGAASAAEADEEEEDEEEVDADAVADDDDGADADVNKGSSTMAETLTRSRTALRGTEPPRASERDKQEKACVLFE